MIANLAFNFAKYLLYSAFLSAVVCWVLQVPIEKNDHVAIMLLLLAAAVFTAIEEILDRIQTNFISIDALIEAMEEQREQDIPSMSERLKAGPKPAFSCNSGITNPIPDQITDAEFNLHVSLPDKMAFLESVGYPVVWLVGYLSRGNELMEEEIIDKLSDAVEIPICKIGQTTLIYSWPNFEVYQDGGLQIQTPVLTEAVRLFNLTAFGAKQN